MQKESGLGEPDARGDEEKKTGGAGRGSQRKVG